MIGVDIDASYGWKIHFYTSNCAHYDVSVHKFLQYLQYHVAAGWRGSSDQESDRYEPGVPSMIEPIDIQ